MKPILIILLSLGTLNLHAQSIFADLYGGAANYQGDLQTKRFDLNQSKLAIGIGGSYDLSAKFSIRGAANYINIAGSDDPGDAAKKVGYRNLQFKSTIWEAQLAMEYNVLDINERGFSPYVFAGLAIFHFNPYAFDTLGNKVFLRPLSTEGQGLPQYPEKKIYANNQFAIPFGAGIKLALTDKLQIGLDVGLRKLMTDYLDDVSGTYADSSTLAAAKGAQAVAFAYRGKEIHGAASYPTAGSIRGNPKNNDWYYITALRVRYSIATKGSNNSKKGKLGCPANIY